MLIEMDAFGIEKEGTPEVSISDVSCGVFGGANKTIGIDATKIYVLVTWANQADSYIRAQAKFIHKGTMTTINLNSSALNSDALNITLSGTTITLAPTNTTWNHSFVFAELVPSYVTD